MLAKWIDVPYDEVTYLCAGINHQAFFLDFRHGKEDLYPQLFEAVEDPQIYGTEPVRIDMMKYFGYFVTESSGHASEYVPYFRKTAQMVNAELVPRFTDHANHWFDFARSGGYLRHCLHRLEQFQSDYDEIVSASSPASAATNMARGSSRRWRPTSHSRSPATCPTTG